MTIKQLIRALEKFPRNTRVFVDGYEAGLCDPSISEEVVHVRLGVNTVSYYGPHEEAKDNFKGATYKGVVLGRSSGQRDRGRVS